MKKTNHLLESPIASRDCRSLIRTAGQDGWKRAEDVTELAQLFTVMPPPPPGA
ncbi:hypothetical protein RA2_03687 [Roseovarius sp. A-2]|uniref:hypothetical protein n=1 Tax=Roseovarius sp. A-2 TaxID=1570360 RepID=UPI0009C8B601|nr:hypothetical protein RA2_03687 [Roseovarius sp. A-2]